MKNNIKDFIEFTVYFDCGAMVYEYTADLETAIILAQACQIRKDQEYAVSQVVLTETDEIVYEGHSQDCTCHNRPGDEYYCSVHGGEGCLIDLQVKSDLIVEKLGGWIVNQSNDVKQSAADAFGVELKLLGQTLQNITDDTIRAAGLDPDEVGQRMKAVADEALRKVADRAAQVVLTETDEIVFDRYCKCGHLVSDHGDHNGHSHRNETTGFCGCVLSRDEAAACLATAEGEG